MMILVSISELLYLIRTFISEGRKSPERFIGTDSSFGFFISVRRKNILIQSFEKVTVGEMKIKEFIVSFWQDIRSFLDLSISELENTEAVRGDLIKARKEFIEFSEKELGEKLL